MVPINSDPEVRNKLQNKKTATVLKVEEFKNVVKKLRLQIENKDIEIGILKNKLNEKKNFSCEHVYHSYVVYKGTDIIAPCKCRQDYTVFLSKELMVKIFLYLPQEFLGICEKVCTRWKEISRDRNLWKQIQLTGGVIHMSAIDRFFALGVKKLIFDDIQILDSPSKGNDNMVHEKSPKLNQMLRSDVINIKTNQRRPDNCNKVVELMMHTIRRTKSSVINEVLRKCMAITSLTLSLIEVGSEIYDTIANFKNLTSLKLINLSLDPASLKMVLESCTTITKLHLSATEDWLSGLPIRFPPQLTELGLDDVLDDNGSNEQLRQIIQKCPNLTSLNIDMCEGLTQSAIYHICSYLPKLQFLSLQGNPNLNYNLAPLKNISTLQEIRLSCEIGDLDPMIQSTLRNVKITVNYFGEHDYEI